jgi:V/A-type H+-transporting ATPase subunit C
MAGCDYANARLRAMKGRLLGPKGVLDLLAQPDLPARLESLKRSDYGAGLAAHLAREPDPLRAAERGLGRRLVEDLVAIDRFLGGEAARGLFRAVLAFEDGRNLKTVLRGITRGEPPDRIFLLVAPTPELDDGALGELARQKDVKAVLDLLTTWRSPYAPALEQAFESFRVQRDLFLLEVALDQRLFADALQAARGDGEDGRMLLGFLETWIDLANAATLLKRADGGRSAELFIPGGRLVTRKRFQQLAELPESALRDALARLGRLHLELQLAAMGERADPFTVDQRLQRALRQAMQREARVHPLSLAVPLSFVLERRAEVQRIRLVLRGAEFGLPGEELLALVES